MSAELFRSLPTPTIIDTRTFEDMKDDLVDWFTISLNAVIAKGVLPASARSELLAALEVEGDPLNMILEAAAYSKLDDAKRTNAMYLQTLLVYASGPNLDVLAANNGIYKRNIKIPAVTDPNTGEVTTPAVYETDDQLRLRVCLQWALVGIGTNLWYKALCLEADTQVKDATATNPGPRAALTFTSTEFSSVGTQSEVDGLSGAHFALITDNGYKYIAFKSPASADQTRLAQMQPKDTLLVGTTPQEFKVTSQYNPIFKRIRVTSNATRTGLSDGTSYPITSPARESANVLVTVQSQGSSPEASDALVNAVHAYITAKDRKVQNDPVFTFSVEAVTWELSAVIEFHANEDAATRLPELTATFTAYARSAEIIENTIYLSHIYQVLSPTYVKGVTITALMKKGASAGVGNIDIGTYQVPVLELTTLSLTEKP